MLTFDGGVRLVVRLLHVHRMSSLVLLHLLVLHAVDVVHDHLLRRVRHLLGVHRLLRWVLGLLQMHLLILNSGRFGAFASVALRVSKRRLAGSLALGGATDGDRGLTPASRELRLRSARYTQSLSVVLRLVMAQMVHLRQGVLLVHRRGVVAVRP